MNSRRVLAREIVELTASSTELYALLDGLGSHSALIASLRRAALRVEGYSIRQADVRLHPWRSLAFYSVE